MFPPHLRKFSDLYSTYSLGAVKNIWLLTCLLPLVEKDWSIESSGAKSDAHLGLCLV